MKIELNINIWQPYVNVINKVFEEYKIVQELRSDGGNFEEQMGLVHADFDDLLLYKTQLIDAMLDQRVGRDYEKMLKETPDVLLYWRHLIQNNK